MQNLMTKINKMARVVHGLRHDLSIKQNIIDALGIHNILSCGLCLKNLILSGIQKIYMT